MSNILHKTLQVGQVGDNILERIPIIEQKLHELMLAQEQQQKRTNEQQETLTQLSKNLAEVSLNIEDVAKTARSIKEMLDVWDSVKGAGRVITWVSAAAKIFMPIAILLTIIATGYQWFKFKLNLIGILP